jgi:putative peptidoglycan lipid II flippase
MLRYSETEMGVVPRAESISRRILSDTITVGAWTAAAKLAGALKVLLMARVFGTSDEMDAYLIGFLVPSFAADVMAGSLTTALLPAFVEVRERESRAAASRLLGNVAASTIAVFGATAILALVCSPLLFEALASGFPSSKMALTKELFLFMLPVIPLSGIGFAWRTVLNAEQRFAAATFSYLITPLISIAALFFVVQQAGVWALAAATSIGCALEALVLAVSVHRAGYPIWPRWRGAGSAERGVLQQYWPAVAGAFLLFGAPLIDQSMAARLGPGSVSALNFGSKLVLVLLAIGPTALGTAVLPQFSLLNARNALSELRHTLRTWIVATLAITVPLTVLLMWASEPLVRILFGSGAFSEASVQAVADIQRLSFVRIPFAVLVALLLRLISSRKENRMLVPAAIIGLALTVALNYIFMRWLGAPGIALSAAVVNFALLLYLAPNIAAKMRSSLPIK